MTIVAAIGERASPNPIVTVGYDLATAFDDELIVLHVVPDEEFERYRDEIGSIGEFREYSITQEEDSAARIAERVVAGTLDEYDRETVSTAGRVGAPVEEILSTAEEVDARYIVIGGRRRSPTGKALFGSVTQSVLLNADVPVMTVMGDE